MTKSVYASCVLILMIAACSGSHKEKVLLKGEWKSKTDNGVLKINDKKFAIDGDLASAEDYFVKGDTIFTSFQGNLPYSKFIVQKLDDHSLKLLSPDSVVMEFTR